MINIDEPRYDQSIYWGRARHFFETTNPINLLVTKSRLEASKDLVNAYKRGEVENINEEELWRAKTLDSSAYHPDTGELMFLPGRMSAQVTMSFKNYVKQRSLV